MIDPEFIYVEVEEGDGICFDLPDSFEAYDEDDD